MKAQPIRIGDKTALGLWEVMRMLPGGEIELFEREQCRFVHSNYFNVGQWWRDA